MDPLILLCMLVAIDISAFAVLMYALRIFILEKRISEGRI